MNCCFRLNISVIDHDDGTFSAFLFPNKQALFYTSTTPEEAILNMTKSKEFKNSVSDSVGIRRTTDEDYLEWLLYNKRKGE